MMTDKTKTPQMIFLQENHGKQEYGIEQDGNISGMVRYFRCDEDYNKIKGVLAMALMAYLDNNRPEGKMCLSNGECKNIDDAFALGDWDIIFRYIEKYLKGNPTMLIERMQREANEEAIRVFRFSHMDTLNDSDGLTVTQIVTEIVKAQGLYGMMVGWLYKGILGNEIRAAKTLLEGHIKKASKQELDAYNTFRRFGIFTKMRNDAMERIIDRESKLKG